MHTHTHTHARARAHTHTHTHTHAYMHIYMYVYIYILGELRGIKGYSETVTRGTRVRVKSFYVPYVP
jgi:hypothetical protein